jgi:hypothetical protein
MFFDGIMQKLKNFFNLYQVRFSQLDVAVVVPF